MLSLVLLLTVVTPTHARSADTLRALSPFVASARIPQDTVRRRPRAIEVSEWYGRRLTIHRTLSYVTIPLFGAQYIAGSKLFDEGSAAPGWAKTTHRYGATALSGVFTVNTVTGLWNLWDSRAVENHRVLRTTHALMMLTADAAFTYAGIKLADEAEYSGDKRRQHRTIALSAMGLTAASGVVMTLFNK